MVVVTVVCAERSKNNGSNMLISTADFNCCAHNETQIIISSWCNGSLPLALFLFRLSLCDLYLSLFHLISFSFDLLSFFTLFSFYLSDPDVLFRCKRTIPFVHSSCHCHHQKYDRVQLELGSFMGNLTRSV